MKSFLEWMRLIRGKLPESDNIWVAAGDDESFEKYGDEVEFLMDVSWDPEGSLEDFEDTRVKEARVGGKPMVITPELVNLAIKTLKKGWDSKYSHELRDKWGQRRRELFAPREKDDYPEWLPEDRPDTHDRDPYEDY